MADTGTFPSLKKILRSDSFTDPTTESNKKTNDYFGGQNVNEVLSAAAQRPTEKFQYLPYNRTPSTAYGDEVSKAYSGDITLEKALENYANKLAEQGKQQGYKRHRQVTQPIYCRYIGTDQQSKPAARPLSFRLAARSPKAGMLPSVPAFPVPCLT